MKVYVKWKMIKHLDLNDMIIGVAVLMSTALCVTVADQVRNGLGRNADTLSPSQLDSFYLSTYLFSLFYILATFLAKLASLHFFFCLSAAGTSIWLVRAVMGCILLWVTVAVVKPSALNWYDLETAEVYFWTVHGVMDIATQIPTAFFPVYLLYHLRTNPSRKLFAMLSFSTNILTIPLIILRLVYIHTTYLFDPNFTWWSYPLFLVSALHANFAIILATIPFAKPIIDSLAIGVISNDIGFDLRGNRNTAGALGKTSSYRLWGGRSSASRVMYGWRKSSVVGNFSSMGGESVFTDERQPGLELKDGTGRGEVEEEGEAGSRMFIRKTMTTIVPSEERVG
ncbi:hypothetical protein MMC30_005777 [Trapelia coarctata]|nr:hypothetical protein [Trapelia coarctata]